MAADFRAFSCSTVLENFQKRIEVLEVYQKSVLAGLSDGSLVVLEPDGNDADRPSWQVVQAMKAFAKKQLLQLKVWHEKSLLLSLDDDGVNAYKLPSFKLHCQANRTRYAHQFCWDAKQARLAVAIKRRLLLFRYDGNEFVELKDVSLPETAVKLAWIGDHICAGLRKEYVLVKASSGAVSELFKLSGEPCIASLDASSELLLAKGNVGIFVGHDGRISRKSSLTWSDSPAAVAFSQPYAVALLPNYIEIRSVQRVSANGLAQVLPLRGMTLAAPSPLEDGSVVVASASDGIRRLEPVPFAQQAHVLADLGEFQEALQLSQLISDDMAEERRELQNELHTRLGYFLFAEGDYDDAMAHFGMCSNANPLVLLNLFPSLAPPQLLEALEEIISGYKLPEMPEPSGDSYQQAVEVLLPYLLSHRSRLASFDDAEKSSIMEDSQPPPDTAAEEGAGRAEQAGNGNLAWQQRHLMARAVDTAILKAMLATSDSGALLRFVQRPNAVDLAEGEAALRARGRYSELVALYQARGRHEEALDLLRRVSQRPHELSIPPQGAAAELQGLTGVWAAVKYLVTVGALHLELVKRHARWILKADPEAGLEMFVQMEGALPPSAALPILTAQAPALCAPYLETSLANGSASASQYHNDLAGIYLRLLLNKPSGAEDQQAAAAAQAEGAVDPMERLKDLVLNSEFVDAQRILLMLPSGALPELRALLLERIGHHEEALRLYIHTMHSPSLAEAYCDRMYAAAAKLQGRSAQPSLLVSYGAASEYEMYLALIQVFLERQGEGDQPGDAPESSNWAAVAQLLGRKHDRIEPMHALQLVPEEVPARTVLPFLEGSLRSLGERRRNASVVRSLRRSENLGVREESVRCKQRSVLVSSERACAICHKRIGNTAFVAYPNASLAHYSCFKRREAAKSAELDDRPTGVKVYDISL